MGNNYLNIEAKKTNYQTKSISPIIIVRRIKGEIRRLSGESAINIASGDNISLEIVLNDTDFDQWITGAIVTYKSDLDPISKVLTENNGIYEGVIENPPDGSHTITISAFAGDDYEFEDYIVILNVGTFDKEPQPDLSWLIYVLIGATVGLITVFSLYQIHFKYPSIVRKTRKLKRRIRKGKKTNPLLLREREDIINKNLQDRLQILNLDIFQSDKILKEKYNDQQNELQ